MKALVKVNETYSYTTFKYDSARLSKISMIEGNGIDGVTNTFAAAIWLVDFLMEATMYYFWDISYYSSGDYQKILGTNSDNFKPTSLYTAMIFITLIRSGSPTLLTPTVFPGSSSKIKIWGF